MRGHRFEEVLRNCREGTPLELTAEEKEHGWHYCPEDQGQLALQRLVGGKPWCGCKLSGERGCTTNNNNNNLNALLESMYFIKRCKKFEYVDGVPTLTVGADMYHSILDRVDIANLRVAGGVGLGTVVSVCGVKLKLEE